MITLITRDTCKYEFRAPFLFLSFSDVGGEDTYSVFQYIRYVLVPLVYLGKTKTHTHKRARVESTHSPLDGTRRRHAYSGHGVTVLVVNPVEQQSRFGDNSTRILPIELQVSCLQNGTAVLKG